MLYQIKALRGIDEVIKLPIEAANETDAVKQAKEKGYTVLLVKPQRLTITKSKRSRFSLTLFSQEFIALLDAGLTLIEALETLAEKENNPAFRGVLEGVLAELYQGKTLSVALEKFPAVFPTLYVASVRASEKTGGIREAVARYISYRAQIDAIRSKVKSASIYPIVLLVVGGAVSLFLLGWVVPKFSRVYSDMSSDLPFISKMLMHWGQAIEGHGGMVFMIAMAIIASIVYAFSTSIVRGYLLQQLSRIPAMGERMFIYQLARFYRTLGMLQRAGIPVVTALEMAEDLLTPAMRASLRQAGKAIREGQALSAAMAKYKLTTPVAYRMLHVGERTGNMSEMLERIASFYEEDLARWVDWFTRLFEPILMMVIGLVIGIIVIFLYYPIFELAGNIQ